ncbi:hypothetical protein Tco_0957174 [Tanacetum coccineum]
MKYVDTKTNSELLKETIYNGLYFMTEITHSETPKDGDKPRVPSYTEKETYANVKPENKKLIDAEVDVVYMILNGIGNDIYSTIDVRPNSKEMWIATERLQQGESINKQDVNTKLFWEFGKFTSKDGESIDSYYIRFYKVMNEMIRNNLIVHTLQFVNQREEQLLVTGNLYETRYSSKCTYEESNEQELEAHYMYMAKIHEVLHATVENSGPTYDAKPFKKIHTNDDYNVFATKRQHSNQLESINDTYMLEKVDSNVIPDSSDMCDNEGKANQNAEEP